ncbi:MAG: type II toxin-antitoxin system RelE family toxin [Candidatus Anammoxibacter sp.]
MSNYRRRYSGEFENDVKVLKKHRELIERLQNKIEEVLIDPHHHKPLRNFLKNKRRIHVGSFVLIFEVLENEKVVVFHSFKHHDIAYKNLR